jgi:hypothetical protein
MMSPISKRRTHNFALYTVTLRGPLSMDILRRHYQRQTLPEEGS